MQWWSLSLAVLKAGGAQDPAGVPERGGHWMAHRRDTIMALKGFVHECVHVCVRAWESDVLTRPSFM